MSYSGFLTPTIFNKEIIDFFTYADIGPLVTGSFDENEEPNISTLKSTDTRLNDILKFTKSVIDDQINGKYGIIIPGSLAPLFSLHAHYAGMKHIDDNTRLSASPDMRKYLRQTMIKVIENDCDAISLRYSQYTRQEIDEIRQKLIDCIDNPDDLSIKDGKYMEIFNPNWFLYAHFSKLISAGRLDMDKEMYEQHKIIQLAYAHKNSSQKSNK
jgi:hypothetical protein